jgi:hypothetical protein
MRNWACVSIADHVVATNLRTFLSMAQQSLIVEALRSHSNTSHSVGLLWTSDQPEAETSTWQHTTLTGDRYPFLPGFAPAISASERPQTHSLDRAATGVCTYIYIYLGYNITNYLRFSIVTKTRCYINIRILQLIITGCKTLTCCLMQCSNNFWTLLKCHAHVELTWYVLFICLQLIYWRGVLRSKYLLH